MASSIKLFVAPLNKGISDLHLKNEFSKFGDLFSASVVKDENGDSKGFGFVRFCSEEDGLKAMKEMNGRILFGTRITIELANSQKGKFRNEGLGKSPVWTSEWNVDYSPINQDPERGFDCQSQISDTITKTSSEKMNLHSGMMDVKERMRRLFVNQCYTDVTFYPKNSRRVSISAHRAVLAIGSPLFTKMLFSGELPDTGKKIEVEISNPPFDAFTSIVKYIYTDEVFFENELLVVRIFEGAKQFEVQPLVSRCEQYFESLELTENNACSRLQLSLFSNIDVLRERCLDFIHRNTQKVINSTKKCSFNMLLDICKLQSLNIRSEVELLEAVMKWQYSQPSQNRRQLLEALLECIRFLTFTISELGDSLQKYPDLMTSDDGLKIMLYLNNPLKSPDFKALPSWCNKNTTSRCFLSEESQNKNLDPVENSTLSDGKVLFPLRPDKEQMCIPELTSLLQMKCISGHHEIRAIKLAFDKPISDKSVINYLYIDIQCGPNGIKTHESIQYVNSDTVRVEFSNPVLVRRGDVIHVEAQAINAHHYRFLKFDDTSQAPLNRHFQCSVFSRPQLDGLYFISEIEYGPQYMRRKRSRKSIPEKFPNENKSGNL